MVRFEFIALCVDTVITRKLPISNTLFYPWRLVLSKPLYGPAVGKRFISFVWWFMYFGPAPIHWLYAMVSMCWLLNILCGGNQTRLLESDTNVLLSSVSP